MNLFFDTEFTSLMDKQPELISIGFVDESGENEFYAELLHDRSKSSHFVVQNVYPLLQGIAKSREEVRANLINWLQKIRNADDVTCCCDYDGDERLLRWLLGSDKPEWMWMINIAHLVYFSWLIPENENPLRHHALHDARELRFRYLNSSGYFEEIL